MRPPLRGFLVLLAAAVLASTGFLLVITVTPVLANRHFPGSIWIGFPSASVTLGLALGTPLLSRVIPHLGRPKALGTGFTAAALAALAPAAVAWWDGPFILYLGGGVLLGTGYSAFHLIRYTAALLFPSRHRGRAIGMVIWMAGVSSLVGPVIFGGIERLTPPGDGAAVALAYLSAAGLFGSACLLLVRSHSLRGLRALRTGRPVLRRTGAIAGSESPGGLAAPVTAMVGAQAGMMLLMTMVPVEVMARGGSFPELSTVMGAHVFGMFGLAPLVGWLSDRFGPRPVILTGGSAVVGSAVLAGAASGTGLGLGAALWLLGFGWSLTFIAASTLLSRGSDSTGKVRRQSRADASNWLVAATANALSGVLMAGGGFAGVALAAAASGLLPVVAGLFLPPREAGRPRVPLQR